MSSSVVRKVLGPWPINFPTRPGAREFYTEMVVRELLLSLSGVVYSETQLPGRKLYFDHTIVNSETGLRTVFEIDGPHHFEDLGVRWGVLSKTRARDVYKTLWCLENGHNIVRIHQPSALCGGELRTETRKAIIKAAFMPFSGSPTYISPLVNSPWWELHEEVQKYKDSPTTNWLKDNEHRMYSNSSPQKPQGSNKRPLSRGT